MESVHSSVQREKRMSRNRKALNVYLQLNEAMECLQHICTEGCTEVGPYDGEPPSKTRGPCRLFRTCQGLQRLIRHFATCEKKKLAVPGGGCAQCKRMWQLLRLHASVCDQPEPCRVPLCRQFKMKMQMEKDDDGMWRLLVKKVVSAKVMSALASRRKMEQGDRLLSG
ncbi:hypothetical protein Taro_013570 [Colocasia esculenta]|uniref:TAZ-type domain-containing protein n=1 Tax=Colocasia esculenta TaxID=4460 RepID=A0A843UJ52_COLES|nr:hypothetical protein [Colocasia esculenta]